MKALLPSLLAVFGVAAVMVAASTGNAPVSPPTVQHLPPVAGYASAISGAGIIEAASRNIAVGAPVHGVVVQVFVAVGTRVRMGDPLFRLDDRDLAAELLTRTAALRGREARVAEMEATLADLANQLALAESVRDPRAISLEDLMKRRHAVRLAEARVATARADVATARAERDQVASNRERLTVRAPIDGDVLQVNLRAGEFAAAETPSTPLLVMGAVERLHVRIDIDENDAWRFQPAAAARVYLRGNRDLTADLTFEYVEPLVVPKRSLTGESAERVDTRVLQVVYSFAGDALQAYVGQQVDVYIEAPAPVPDTGSEGGTGAPAS